MLPISPDKLARWRTEIDLGLAFLEKEFGVYRKQTTQGGSETQGAGSNLDLFEQGADGAENPPLNIVFPIVKNVVATMFFQNPRVLGKPESRGENADEDAFYAAELLNRDLRDVNLRIKETGQLGTFDTYVLGQGYLKVGYATKFGEDITPTKAEDRQHVRERLKTIVNELMVGVGLKEPTPPKDEPEVVGENEVIRAESPYMRWVDTFNMVMDPRARDLTDAAWVAERFRRTIRSVKEDRRYGPEKNALEGESLNDTHIPDTEIEAFQSVEIWEVHYKNPDSPTGITVLTFAATQTDTKALMHEHNVYDIGGWQYERGCLNKHGYRLYPVSTISIIAPLIKRINRSVDAILEQVDKFSAKIVHNERVGPEAQIVLEDGTIGNRVKVEGTEDVNGAIRVISMEQVKSDLLILVNQIIDFVILITGLTRAQLTGLDVTQTATASNIAQSGQNLRRGDEANQVSDWFTRALTKYWRVKAQFQDLTQIDLPKETTLPNPQTGIAQTQWYPPIDEARAERLKRGKFQLSLEVSSMQKPNLEIIRAQFQEVVTTLLNPLITNGLALEGKRLSASEAMRQWDKFFSEYGISLEKIIVPVSDPLQQQALLNFGQKPEAAPAQSGNGQLTGAIPTLSDQISAAAGEKGQGASPV